MLIAGDALRKVVEEVVPEDAGDAPQQSHVDVFLGEYLVHVGAGATQLHCKPSDRTPLLTERAADKVSDVAHASRLLSGPDSLRAAITSPE